MTWGDAFALLWFLAAFIGWAFIHAATRGYKGDEPVPADHPPGRCMNAECMDCLGDTRAKLRDEMANGREC